MRWGVVVFGLAGLDTAGEERPGTDGEARLFGLGAVWRVREWMVRKGRNGMENKINGGQYDLSMENRIKV